MALHVEHGLAQRQAADDSAPAVIDWLARCAESLRRWSAQVARSHTIASLGLAGMVGQRSCHYMDPDPVAERLVERLSLDETAPLALEPARCDVTITHLGQALA